MRWIEKRLARFLMVSTSSITMQSLGKIVNKHHILAPTALSILKKKIGNRIKIDPLTVTQYMFELCTPRTNNAPASERDSSLHR